MLTNFFLRLSLFVSLLRKLTLGLCVTLIRGYQYCLSPLFPPACRFHPTCSTYAVEALQRFGICKGGWLAIGRILRCHPFHAGGVDLVPEQFSFLHHKDQKKHHG